MSQLVRFSVSIPEELAAEFDKHIETQGYASRSEAIRDFMRDYLLERTWQNEEAEVAGTVTIVYNHESSDLAQALASLQHQYHKSVLCTTHIHLDEHNCLEVVVLRGSSRDVRAIADALLSTKGVKHGRLVTSAAQPISV